MYKKVILSLLFVTSTMFGFAQDMLNLDDYRFKVVEYSQELKQAREGVISAQSQVSAVKTGFLPSLAVSIDGNYQLNQMKFDLGDRSMTIKPWAYSAGATVSQNIYSGSAVRNQYEAAKIGNMIAQETQKLTIDNILYMADIHYWNLAAYIAMLEVAVKNVKLINDLYIVVKNRYEDGLIAKNDLLMIETRKMEAELQKSIVDRKYVSALIGFNTLMGINNDTKMILLDVIEKEIILPNHVAIDNALSLRPEYQIAANQIKLDERMLSASLAQFRPQVIAGITGSYGSQMINVDGSGIGNGIIFGQISVPVFQWNKKKHVRAIGQSTLNSSIFQQTIVKDKILQELNTAWVNMTLSNSELKIAHSTLRIAQESLDINTLSYNEGRLTILDVLTSQLSWLLSVNNVITTYLQSKSALSQYQRVTGAYNHYDYVKNDLPN